MEAVVVMGCAWHITFGHVHGLPIPNVHSASRPDVYVAHCAALTSKGFTTYSPLVLNVFEDWPCRQPILASRALNFTPTNLLQNCVFICYKRVSPPTLRLARRLAF